jgi:hypothetical protein
VSRNSAILMRVTQFRRAISIAWIASASTLALHATAFAAEAPGRVHQIAVLPDKAPDCRSLKSIVESVTRDCRTNDEKAIAIYNFCQLTNYHRAYPTEPGGIPALKVINCYGWSLCGGLHSIQSALWKEAGWEHRFVGWNGHTTVEAKYDGRWHYLDVFLKFYAWEPDGKGGRTIASQDDLTANSEALIKQAFVLDAGRGCVYAKDNQFVMTGEHANWRAPALLSCGDTIADVIGGLKTHRGADRADSWMGINHADGNYSADLALVPGMGLTNTWDAVEDAWYWADQKTAPGHTCPGFKDNRNDPAYGLILEPYINASRARSYGTGMISFQPDFSSDAVLASFVAVENARFADQSLVPSDALKPAFVVLKIESPYILTKASGQAEGADTVEVSTDGGKTFAAVELKDFSTSIKGRTAALIKVGIKTSLRSLKLEALVQNNPGSLPYLSPGKNVVTVSVASPAELGNNKLVVTYAYRLGGRTKSFDQLCEEGKEIARQHNAKWSDTVTYVQKAFTAKELPASFEIDCPTPRGQYPVYPRMVMLRRELISPTAAPLALPAGAAPAVSRPGDELATLPNPFLIGSEPPQPVKPTQVTTTRLPLQYVRFCTEKGEVSEAGLLAWPKNGMEQGKVISGAVLVDGDLSSLPGKKLVAARLVVPVLHGHSMAGGKLGAVFLTSPIKPGQPCDFKQLGNIAGSTVVPVQPQQAPEYKPAKAFAIDVTRAIKEIASGDGKFNGIALRIVPDRSVDDGYTVRCRIAPREDFYLELDLTADDKTTNPSK